MRLWHQDIIEKLPRAQLLGQHRECCALRGKGWGRTHSVVDYVFTYSPYKLFQYHKLVIDQMTQRSYKFSEDWLNPNYRGKSLSPNKDLKDIGLTSPIYPEHNRSYYRECQENLLEKGIVIELYKEQICHILKTIIQLH